jgi:lysophospholipase L1-like esterase
MTMHSDISKIPLLICATLLMALLPVRPASATGCPLINGMIDFNCDGKIKITFAGDSIVKGIGDSLDPIEGYPGRIQTAWPWAEIRNIGIPGITSGRLLRTLKKNLSRGRNNPISEALHDADIIALTVGVNDYWVKTDVGVTIGNIASAVNYLRLKLRTDDGVAPFVAVGTLLQTQRTFQQPFVLKVNQLLLRYSSSQRFPVVLRFDRLNVRTKSYLRGDRLHPNSNGYDAMQNVAMQALQGRTQQLMSRERTDKDADGIYDQVEPVFGTDSRRLDTDGDTLADGAEVFEYLTDPTKRDTNDNGIDDNLELPTPTPTPTHTATPTATPPN